MNIECLRPTWAEINLDNLRHNLEEIKGITSPHSKICAVIKADGYGHGAVEIAREAVSYGVSYLAVSVLDEALELRQSGIHHPVLILGFTPEAQFDKIIEHKITQTVYDLKSAKRLSQKAIEHGKKAKIHIKLDTGMSRLGFRASSESISEIKALFSLEGLEIEGIFTHFARADERDRSATQKQLNLFMDMVKAVEEDGYKIPLKHAANSAAILEFPNSHLDMVRAGIILYGLYPSDEVTRRISLKPLLSLKTKVSHIKTLPKGTPVSYGGTFVTSRPSLVATLPIGYADGYSRLLSSKADVLINGQRAPVIGRICMDQCIIDITDVQGDVHIGQEVVLIGSDGSGEISADELAKIVGTINYEIVCGISKRVPRVYIKDGKVHKVKNLLVK